MLKCRTVPPGSRYYREVSGQIHKVPDSHIGLVCEGCEYSVHLPKRYGKAMIENVRKMHLEKVHFEDVVAGRMQISEEDLEFQHA